MAETQDNQQNSAQSLFFTILAQNKFNMKKLALILASAAMMLLAGCNKEEGKSEVGKWYAYNTADSKNDIALVLELKADGTADYMITAWGCRWRGPYTYDGKVVKITWNKYLARPAALSEGWQDANGNFIYCTEPAHIYDKWQELTILQGDDEIEANRFGATIEIPFTFSGDTGTMEAANKSYPAERQ